MKVIIKSISLTKEKDKDFLLIDFEDEKRRLHSIKIKGKDITEGQLKVEIKNYLDNLEPEPFKEWEGKEIEI